MRHVIRVMHAAARRPGLVVVLIGLCAIVPARAEPFGPDPVQALRQALQAPVRDPSLRERSLKSWTERLSNLTDLARALLLDEWRDEDVDEQVAVIDRRCRTVLMQQFEQTVHRQLQQGDPATQMAVADLVAGLGVTARAPGSCHSIGHAFGPDLARLVHDGEPHVRAAAARALGRIHPDPNVALPALEALLQDAEAEQRLTAAEALLNLVEVIAQLTARSRNATGVQATRTEVVQVGQAVVRTAGRGLSDAYPEVRRLCVAVMGQAAGALGRLILEPPLGESTSEEWGELMPLLLALRDQGPGLARVLGDPQAAVGLQALRTLQEIAVLRARLLGPAPAAGPDPLLEGLSAALPLLAQRLADPDVRLRLAAVDVLEPLGPAAAPAAAALERALTDPDRFVRRSAARTLGTIGPPAASAAVTPLAHLLQDADPDLARTAAAALERFGPAARDAVPLLVQTAGGRVAPDVRIAALRVLAAIGSPDADPAVSVLSAALADPDDRIRHLAAVGLGRFGPAARPAVEALCRARTDPSPAVQQAAGDAVLLIVQPADRLRLGDCGNR